MVGIRVEDVWLVLVHLELSVEWSLHYPELLADEGPGKSQLLHDLHFSLCHHTPSVFKNTVDRKYSVGVLRWSQDFFPDWEGTCGSSQTHDHCQGRVTLAKERTPCREAGLILEQTLDIALNKLLLSVPSLFGQFFARVKGCLRRKWCPRYESDWTLCLLRFHEHSHLASCR